ncbi:MAG: HD domain-containing phosphohydrolase [Clostridium sp.]|uniref:HD domain-containing phosphohydrolase n=1 Tax=Clostridium sp. TaxID=1506 RepID=UPI003F2EDA89
MDFISLIIENIPLGIWIEDKNGKIKLMNLRFRDALKIKDEKGTSLCQIVKKYDFRMEGFNVDNHIGIKINGKDFICVAEKIIIKDGEENLIGAVGIIRNPEMNYLKKVIDTIPYIISYKDLSGNLVGCNKAFKEFLSVEENELIGTGYLEKTKGNELVTEIQKRDARFKGKDEPRSYEIMYSDKNVMEVLKYPIKNEKNKIVGVLGISKDISENKIIQNEIIEATYRDKATGLYNRNYFEKISEELNKHYEEDLLLVMGDADGLKVVNDSLGHFEGDRYLREIGEIIIEAVDGKGDVIRWGGDEFIVLIPNGTNEIGKKIKEKISSLCKVYSEDGAPISISVGYSIKNEVNKTIEDMLNVAEEIVYKEKVFKGEKIKEEFLEFIQEKVYLKTLENENRAWASEDIVKKIGEKLKLSKEEVENINLALKFHDIGMIAVPDEIIDTPIHKLTNEQAEILRRHVDKSYRIIKMYPKIAKISKIVLSHHEYYNGKGYPLGLKGEDIPIESRVVRVLDCYDYYKRSTNGLTEDEVLEIMKSDSGRKYDPKVLEIFLETINKMKIKSE